MWPILWWLFLWLETISSLATGQQDNLLFYFSRGCHHLVCTAQGWLTPPTPHHQISGTNHLSGKYWWKTCLTPPLLYLQIVVDLEMEPCNLQARCFSENSALDCNQDRKEDVADVVVVSPLSALHLVLPARQAGWAVKWHEVIRRMISSGATINL